MALKPNQLQVTTHKQMQSLSEYKKLCIVNEMLRSFELENETNHENLKEQEFNPFDYFLQSTAWSIRSTYHTTLQVSLSHLDIDILKIQEEELLTLFSGSKTKAS
jgi:hypothetical protein